MFEVQLYPNASIIDLPNLQVPFDIYFMTTGSGNFNEAEVWFVADNMVVLACTPLSAGPNQWTTLTCSSFTSSATRLTVATRISSMPWVGTIFVDNVEFSSK